MLIIGVKMAPDTGNYKVSTQILLHPINTIQIKKIKYLLPFRIVLSGTIVSPHLVLVIIT